VLAGSQINRRGGGFLNETANSKDRGPLLKVDQMFEVVAFEKRALLKDAQKKASVKMSSGLLKTPK